MLQSLDGVTELTTFVGNGATFCRILDVDGHTNLDNVNIVGVKHLLNRIYLKLMEV